MGIKLIFNNKNKSDDIEDGKYLLEVLSVGFNFSTVFIFQLFRYEYLIEFYY